MPVQSVWMLRISLVYLLAAFVIGGVLLTHKGVGLASAAWSLLPVHIEIALFGWLIQFVMGTAYWMLPRFLTRPKRGDERLGWLMILLLNAGIWLYISTQVRIFPAPGFLVGRLLELSAVAIFVTLHWNRIVPYRRGH